MKTDTSAQKISFYILFGLLALLAVMTIWPFWQLLALAAVLSILFHPWYLRILARLKSPSGSAVLATLLILLVVIVFLWLVGYVLFLEANNVFNNLKNGGTSFDQAAIISRLPDDFRPVAANFLQGFYSWLSSFAGNAVQNITAWVTNVLNFFLASFVVFFSLFFFLRDGRKLKDFFQRTFPLSQAHESLLIDKLEHAVNGVIKGTFLVALIAGLLSTLGFLLFGMPQPFLWGAFTVLAAFVPTIGTALTMLPAAAYLLLIGQTGTGLALLIWFVIVNVLMNNFVSPKIIGDRTEMHPLLVLLSVLGGLQLFGFFGFLFGPILMAVFLALLEIYRAESSGS